MSQSQNFILLDFFVANSFTCSSMLLKSILFSSTLRMDIPVNHSWLIVERRYFLMSLSLDKERSTLAKLTGSVKLIYRPLKYLETNHQDISSSLVPTYSTVVIFCTSFGKADANTRTCFGKFDNTSSSCEMQKSWAHLKSESAYF